MPFDDDPADQFGDQFGDQLGDDLGAALRRTADTFSTDNQALATAGAARGRVLRRRRTTAIVAGAAGLALVGAGGFSLTGLLPWDASVRPSAVVPTSVASGQVIGDDTIALLKGLLPKGKFSHESSRTDSSSDVAVSLVYDDGHGASAISVFLSRVSNAPLSCPGTAYAAKGTTCQVIRLDGGGELYLSQGYEYPDRHVDTKHWNAVLTTSDGRRIDVSEWNAPAEKDAAITRTDPPLTPAQLRAIAGADDWTPVFDSIPTPKPVLTTPTATTKQILNVVTGLLPAGLSTQLPPASETFPHLTVDDGHGKSLVEINYDHWEGYTDAIFAGATVLPDGTKVIVRKQPAGKGVAGAVIWTVNTVRPNGLRVAVSELNAAGYHQATSRKTPVLSVAELKAIATSGTWAKLG
ncbi:MAG: hypothetical protein QOF84_7093 [Streptomyces sp.]|nr:hypothetical protein [Streptomyces sp.]